MRLLIVIVLIFLINDPSVAQQDIIDGDRMNIGGVMPHLTLTADHSPRTEAGIGAIMPWANHLWLVTYVAHKSHTGSGTGLYSIDENLNLSKHSESVVGTYANRLLHGPSDQLFIGPHVIDTLGTVRTIDGVKNHRLAATMEHLTDPEKVYFLAMEGEFFEVNVYTLETTLLFNLMDELKVPGGAKPHFKDGFTHHGRVVVANNTYSHLEDNDGRLAEWFGGDEWHILEETAFTEVWSARQAGQPMIATGWDKASVILKVLINDEWLRYRLPKASRAFDQTSYTEWMRIRSVETERALMDVHGMFYEIGYHTYSGGLWAISPISRHLRVIPDFASWRGMLVLAGNQATPMQFATGNLDRDPFAGQPQAGLWFGKTDDLWSWGKPAGSGGVWYDSQVEASEYSDPFLMSGFDKKSVHMYHDSDEAINITFEVDVVGDGNWMRYETFTVESKENKYHEFPSGYNPMWIRVKTDKDCIATVYFNYS